LKLEIQDFCIRCGICITLYPELFEMDFEKDKVRVKPEIIPESLVKAARQSVKDCAVAAIKLIK
jgi:ferredoxin